MTISRYTNIETTYRRDFDFTDQDLAELNAMITDIYDEDGVAAEPLTMIQLVKLMDYHYDYMAMDMPPYDHRRAGSGNYLIDVVMVTINEYLDTLGSEDPYLGEVYYEEDPVVEYVVHRLPEDA